MLKRLLRALHIKLPQPHHCQDESLLLVYLDQLEGEFLPTYCPNSYLDKK